MFKDKIKEALQQGHKNLGLGEEVFERVATSVETFITDEADIDKYVKSELVKSLLKFEQADADRKRAKREGEKKEPGNGNQPPKTEPETKPQDDEKVPAWAQVLIDSNKALSDSNKALSEKLAGFEAAKAKEAAVAALDKFVNEWDYAKGFPKEAAEAKRIAMKLYAKGGESMTAEELIAEFRGEFDPAVKDKGVTDFTKPFESDGGGKSAPDFKNEVEILKSAGVEMPE